MMRGTVAYSQAPLLNRFSYWFVLKLVTVPIRQWALIILSPHNHIIGFVCMDLEGWEINEKCISTLERNKDAPYQPILYSRVFI
jgi:hypothetical protein